jgi:phosphatidate cytidylyltransferase
LEGKYNNFLKRIITTIIGIPLIVLIIFWGEFPFFIIIMILAFLGLNELYNMAHKQGYKPSYILGSILTAYFIFTTFYDIYNLKYYKNVIVTFFIIICFIIQLFKKDFSKVLPDLSIPIFGSIYLGYLLSFLLKVKFLPNGNYYLLCLLFITWANDVGAYIIGINFGKNRIYPKISPKKSLEGSVGGILFSIIITFALRSWLNLSFNKLISLGLILSIVGQLGDLFESVLKRGSGVKDSGKLIPGHGGILDCFDSLLFTAPIFYYYIKLLI